MSEEEKEQFRAEANQRRLKNNSAYMRRKREQERRVSGKPKRVVYTPEERKVKRKEWRKRWLEKNPEKVKEYNKRNRTLMLLALPFIILTVLHRLLPPRWTARQASLPA